jgi:uncharacterized membrane protein YagU involved in acid resistance
MDGFSLIIGGLLGGLAGWAFSNAIAKRREASKGLNEADKAWQKMSRIEGEFRDYRGHSFTDTVQGFLFYLLGFAIVFILVYILVSSLS